MFHILQFHKVNYRDLVRSGGNFMVKSDHLRVQTIRSIRLRILAGISEVRQYFKAKMVQAAERAFCGDHSLQTTALMPRRTSKPGCRVSICGNLSKWQLCRCFFECFSEKVQYTHCVCVYPSFISASVPTRSAGRSDLP